MNCKILFNDEICFNHTGVNSSRNYHLWDHLISNWRIISINKYQYHFSINVSVMSLMTSSLDCTSSHVWQVASFQQNELPDLLQNVQLCAQKVKCTVNMMQNLSISVDHTVSESAFPLLMDWLWWWTALATTVGIFAPIRLPCVVLHESCGVCT